MSDGLLLILVAVYEHYTGNNVKWPVYASIVALGLLVASYMVWHKQRRLYLEELAKNACPELDCEIVRLSYGLKFDRKNLNEPLGINVNTKINFCNKRPTVTTVKSFFLILQVGDRCFLSHSSEEGETIYERLEANVDGTFTNMGRVFTNLYKPPMVAEHNVVHTGWLQFYFEGVNAIQLMNGHAQIVMVDHNNVWHPSRLLVVSTAQG